jgi:hypothetical protein
MRVVLSAFLMLFLQGCVAGTERQPMKEISREDARVIAEQAFKKSDSAFTKNYTVEEVDDRAEESTWSFFFRGAGDYARPGYHATVKVDKKNGKVEIIGGE